ncbi:MAG TPA: hypothetical protein VE844_20290 [Gammaproteobacteria bacterium]|nr:hypothetical protein [Gammaproteobacteria bacterium]
MTRVVITAMLAWLTVGVWAVPARAAVDIHIGIPGVVIVPPSDYYVYPRYVYPYSEPRHYYGKHHHRWHHHGHRHHGHRHHHHGHGR